MSEVMSAKQFLEALKSGRRNFQKITINEQVVIEDAIVRGSRPCINCEDAQIKKLIVNDNIEHLRLHGSLIERLIVGGKIKELLLQNATIGTLNLLKSKITLLYLSGITITKDLLFSELKIDEVNCGDNLGLAWFLHLQGQKVITNYKAVESLFSSLISK